MKRNRTLRREKARDILKFKKELGIKTPEQEAELIGRLLTEVDKGNVEPVQNFLKALPPEIGQEYASKMEYVSRQVRLLTALQKRS